jgi:hypothetical protein
MGNVSKLLKVPKDPRDTTNPNKMCNAHEKYLKI